MNYLHSFVCDECGYYWAESFDTGDTVIDHCPLCGNPEETGDRYIDDSDEFGI